MYKQLTSQQRYAIYLGIKRGCSKTGIAREIGVHPATVVREIKRNANRNGEYVWLNANKMAQGRRHGLPGNRSKPSELWWRIDSMIIDEEWSPEQIAGVLRREGKSICKQTIYNHVHADRTGELARHMPHWLKYTRRTKALRPTKATNIANRTSIHQRPPEADGKRFGDWEMDTIVDSYGHAILTLVERSTNYLKIARLPEGRKALPTARMAVRLLYPFRDQIHTITTDNGCEFAAHLEITKRLSRKGHPPVTVYFADSYCSWQKGAIENANKLIRRYIPKKADFSKFSDRKIMMIQKKINRRPRRKLNFDCPLKRFFQHFP